MGANVRRHPLAWFFALAIVLSWGYWIAVALAGGEGSHVPGLVGPAVAGVVVTALADGSRGVTGLLRRLGRWRVGPRWYAAAFAPLLAGAVGMAIVALVEPGSITGATLGRFPGLPDVGWLGVFLLALVVNGFGEEIGWRGFAWPRLRARRSLAAAAGVLTVPWAIWHVPTFWLDTGLDLDPWVVPGWLVGLAAGAVVLGWLYERTGSLLVVGLFHASLNMVSATEAAAGLPAAITSMGVIVAAILVLRRQGRAEAMVATDRAPRPLPAPLTHRMMAHFPEEAAVMTDFHEQMDLPEATTAAVRARREALHAAMTDLERELDALEVQAEPDRRRLRTALAGMQATLREHVRGADAPDGPLAQIIGAAPWLGTRARRLQDEHHALLDRATTLVDRVDTGDPVAPVLQEARNLAGQVGRHRHRAASVLQDAYTLDIAAAD